MLTSYRVTTVFNNTGNVRMTCNYVFWVCSCSLRFQACNGHASCCNMWPVWLCNIFPTISHKRLNFRETLLNVKCVLILSTTFFWNISHSKKKLARYDKKCMSVFMHITCYSFWILINVELLGRFSKQTQPPNTCTGLFISPWNILKIRNK
jgi:hypothetical protein